MVRPSVFGIGWAGGKMNLLEVVWRWKGVILISIYSIIATIGLIKNSKIGIIFGYTISVFIFIYFLVHYCVYPLKIDNQIPVRQLIWMISFLGLFILLFYGLTILRKAITEFKLKDYITGAMLLIMMLAFFNLLI
ncbi:hypothetical protein [Winogradskyella sp.]|uniref:hypothetical protein n=1 Tax=Winogradskyella sp. TaxID=1883156 RepID=UPI00386BA40D